MVIKDMEVMYLSPESFPTVPLVLDGISSRFIRENKIIPLELKNSVLKVVLANPRDSEIVEALKAALLVDVVVYAGDIQSIDDYLSKFYGQGSQNMNRIIEDMDQRGLLDETLVVALGEFGRTPERGLSTSGNVNSSDGRDHWPYCYTACVAGAGIKRGYIHGESDATGSSPKSDPVHPTELLALIYHACGIDPETIVYNHLNQPRELVKAKPVTALFA